MNDQDLINLLSSKERSSAKTRRCPDENLFAGYIQKQLSEKQRVELERHFADCDACTETISLLVTAEDTPLETVPAALLVRARSLAEPKPRFGWRWQWAFATATACLLVVVLFAVWQVRRSHPVQPTELVAIKTEPTSPPIVVPSPSVRQTGSSVQPFKPEVHAPAVRGNGNDAQKPIVVMPRNGGIVNSEQLSIRWKPVPDASFYEVTIVTNDGGHVLTESTNTTEFSVHDHPLQTSGKYFVIVTAHLNNNRTVRSDLVRFQVTSKP